MRYDVNMILAAINMILAQSAVVTDRRAMPSLDEFPMLHTLVGDFSGLIDLWERDRCPKTLSQQW